MSKPQENTSIMGIISKNLKSILIGLIVVSFAMWGVTDAFTPQTRDAAAMVGDEKITLREFDKFFQRRLREENEKLPERISTKQAYARGFHNTVLGQLVTEKLIKIDADNLGVDINRRDSREYIENMEVFNNVITGEFDEQKLLQFLARPTVRQSRKEFNTNIYNGLRLEQTTSSITTGIVAPIDFAEQNYKFMTEQRKVKLLHLTREAVTIPADPTDDELKTYIEEHVAVYTAPEYRKFTILRVETADLLRDMEVTEKEITDRFDYQVQTGELGSDETRSLTQITVGEKAAADIVTTALNAGKTIDDIVSENGFDAPETYTDILATATTDPNTGEAAFTQAQGVATTVEGSFGTWYSVIVTAINPAIIPDIETQRAEIVKALKLHKAQQVIYDLQDPVQDALAEGSTIEETARANGISAASVSFVSRLGEAENGDPMIGLDELLGVGRSELVLKEIFTNDIGFEGDIFETANQGLAAVRVDAIKESTQRPFEEVKEKALTAWRLEKTSEALAVLIDDLADKALKGESLENLLASIETGASIQETIMVRLGRGLPSLSQNTNIRMFEARQDQTIRGTAVNGLDRVIGQIMEITPNSEVLIGSIASTLKEQSADALNNDIQTAYRQAMLKDNPSVSIDVNIQNILGITE